MSLPTSYTWILSLNTSGGAIPAGRGVTGNRTSGEGKTGLALPFSADGRGRLALVSGNNQLEKIIILNLSDLESENPFQSDLGLGADMVFAVASDKLRAEVNRRIKLLFRRLQLSDRARLEGPVIFTTDDNLQEMTVDIKYINLEEDKPGELGITFSLLNATG